MSWKEFKEKTNNTKVKLTFMQSEHESDEHEILYYFIVTTEDGEQYRVGIDFDDMDMTAKGSKHA